MDWVDDPVRWLLQLDSIFWIGFRVRQRKWFLWGLLYSVSFIMAMLSEAVEFSDGLFGLSIIGVWIGSTVHAFLCRKEYLLRLDALRQSRVQRDAEMRDRIAAEYGIGEADAGQVRKAAAISAARTPAHHPPKQDSSTALVDVPRTVSAVSPSRGVDLNSAPEESIAALPGVGLILAKKAVDVRAARGGFHSIDEFAATLNLKPHVVERLRPLITIRPPQGRPTTAARRLVDY